MSASTAARGLGHFDKGRKYARQALTFKQPNLSPENAQNMKEFLQSLQPRTYTVNWKLDTSKGWGEKGGGKGPFYVPIPSTDLPYQNTTFTVRGARSHKTVTRDGVRLLLLESDGNMPVEITATVTVCSHDYRPKIKAEKAQRYPDEAQTYLGAGERLDPNSKKVQAVATKVKGDTPTATINDLLAWLKKNMTYKPVTFDKVDQILDRGYGDCGAYSAVFVAVCRASGIPAREVWGVYKTTTRFAPDGHMGSHAWAEV